MPVAAAALLACLLTAVLPPPPIPRSLQEALEAAKTTPPKRERGLMVRGERKPKGVEGWGTDKGGQFH